MNVPSPEDPPTESYPDKDFKFDRLGVRIPTLLASPWIPKGTVISSPPDAQKPNATSEYDLTSILATVRKLFPEMAKTPPLTRRDAWAATFEHALSLDTPRTDAPMHLPDAIPPILPPMEREAHLPLNELQEHIATLHAFHGAGGVVPSGPRAWERDGVSKQRHVSGWLQAQYAKHRVHHHRRHSPAAEQEGEEGPFKLIVHATCFDVKYCGTAKTGDPGFVSHHWVISDIPAPDTTPRTISTKSALDDHAEEEEDTTYEHEHKYYYCLDLASHARPIVEGTRVTVARCGENRTAASGFQQWYMRGSDTTLRPLEAPSLCATAHSFDGRADNHTLDLQPCDPSAMQQHYGWQGDAPGASSGAGNSSSQMTGPGIWTWNNPLYMGLIRA